MKLYTHTPSPNCIKVAAVAYSLGEQVPSARNNVFIHHCCAHSGQVFDGGDIVRWPAPGEPS